MPQLIRHTSTVTRPFPAVFLLPDPSIAVLPAQSLQPSQSAPAEAVQPSSHRLLAAPELRRDRRYPQPGPSQLDCTSPHGQITWHLAGPHQPTHDSALFLIAAGPRPQHHRQTPTPSIRTHFTTSTFTPST